MAITRRLQILKLLRQADKGSVAITLPTQLQAKWDALLVAYQAQTTALKDNWNLQVKQSIAADTTARLTNMPPQLLTQLGKAIEESTEEGV